MEMPRFSRWLGHYNSTGYFDPQHRVQTFDPKTTSILFSGNPETRLGLALDIWPLNAILAQDAEVNVDLFPK
jgi:hypothetical protein